MPVKPANVWVISPFSDPAAAMDRYRYVCHELTGRGAQVCQYISSFSHLEKKHRRSLSVGWRCVRVPELGYSRNVGIGRVLSHLTFDLAIIYFFVRELLRSGVPDTIFSALPHNGAACVAAVFAKLVRARFVADIHDTWPESILSVATVNAFSKIGFFVWKCCADLPLILADDVFGESVRYADRANSIRDRFGRSKAIAIYIGGDAAYYKGIEPADTMPTELNDASFIVSYAGSLGSNYDLDCLIDAFSDFEKECPEAGLMILGCGERESEIRARVRGKSRRAWISGRLDHECLLGYLKRSQVGVNCFKAGGNVAYSYKINDYLLVGLPVINSLDGEVADLISSNHIGANYRAGDRETMLAAMWVCYKNWKSDPCWARKSLEFCSESLDRSKSYRPLIECCLR